MTAPVGPPGGGSRPDRAPELDELIEVVARALDRPPVDLQPPVPVAEVCADSLDLYCLYVTLDEWVPGFLLPRQLGLDVATLADVHHYLVLRFEQGRDR